MAAIEAGGNTENSVLTGRQKACPVRPVTFPVNIILWSLLPLGDSIFYLNVTSSKGIRAPWGWRTLFILQFILWLRLLFSLLVSIYSRLKEQGLFSELPSPRCGLLYGLLVNGPQSWMLSFRSNWSVGWLCFTLVENDKVSVGRLSSNCCSTRASRTPLPSPPLPPPSASEREKGGMWTSGLQLHLQARFEELRLLSRGCDYSLTHRSVSSECNAGFPKKLDHLGVFH